MKVYNHPLTLLFNATHGMLMSFITLFICSVYVDVSLEPLPVTLSIYLMAASKIRIISYIAVSNIYKIFLYNNESHKIYAMLPVVILVTWQFTIKT